MWFLFLFQRLILWKQNIKAPDKKPLFIQKFLTRGFYYAPCTAGTVLLAWAEKLRMMSRFSVLVGQLERWEPVLRRGISQQILFEFIPCAGLERKKIGLGSWHFLLTFKTKALIHFTRGLSQGSKLFMEVEMTPCTPSRRTSGWLCFDLFSRCS